MSNLTTIPINADIRVHDLLSEYPILLQVFARAGMNCPGCPFDAFHTIADACREHHRDLNAFMNALKMTLAQKQD